ncbi:MULTISPECIES: hypothetical protein [Halomonadaceae]|uniref:hypothetical protein n=1 Tax=Halomonas TaxID=2745 RepID=UPI0018A77998|nr:hypothetical protein [Halomonas sp. 328]MBF8221833.1 hypothetical protein [Halomonas sp. 328]
MQVTLSPDCPDCGARLKRLPPTRHGHGHVYCLECGHDFGRYEALAARFRQELDTLEARLGLPPAPPAAP